MVMHSIQQALNNCQLLLLTLRAHWLSPAYWVSPPPTESQGEASPPLASPSVVLGCPSGLGLKIASSAWGVTFDRKQLGWWFRVWAQEPRSATESWLCPSWAVSLDNCLSLSEPHMRGRLPDNNVPLHRVVRLNVYKYGPSTVPRVMEEALSKCQLLLLFNVDI